MLVQGRRNSIATALELHLSCTNTSRYTMFSISSIAADVLALFVARSSSTVMVENVNIFVFPKINSAWKGLNFALHRTYTHPSFMTNEPMGTAATELYYSFINDYDVGSPQILTQWKNRTRTPAFWGFPPPHTPITHTTDSYWIPSPNKTVKVTNLKNLPKLQIFEIWKNFLCNTPSEVAC